MRLFHFHEGEGWKIAEDATILNRAFLYGDGFFETGLATDGIAGFWNVHLERLNRTLTYLNLELPVDSIELFKGWPVLSNVSDLRFRLCVFRAGIGRYTPETNRAEAFLMLSPYQEDVFFSKAPIEIDVSKVQLPIGEIGNYKVIGKHLQVKAAIEAQKNGKDDLLLLNTNGELTETISSNVFLLIASKLYTPPLSSGCLNGTIRQVLKEHWGVEEQTLTLEDVAFADSILTTNSVIGIREVYYRKLKSNGLVDKWQEKLRALRISSIRDFPGS